MGTMEKKHARNATAFLREEYQDLVAKGFDWKLRTLTSGSDPRCVVDGKKVIMLCSNNYLNLATHPKVVQAAIEATQRYGGGSGSVRPIAGNLAVHDELERRIARFKKTEASLFYQSGYAVNAGLIPQLAGEGDLILSDELNHGSIIDGSRLSKAERGIYKHCDMADMERVLANSEKYRRILIITDGVFSMDGDVAPADQIVKIAGEFGAMVYVDDSHGEAVLGEHGRGVGEHFHIEGKIDVEMGTFSKGLGVVGGFAAGSTDLRNFALNKSRSWLLSASHPAGVAASCIAALEVMETEPQHVQRLWENTKYWKKALVDLGFDIGNSVSPITPVMCGESHTARKLSDLLFGMGVFAFPIVFPMVARDKARIRTMITAGLTREDLDEALRAFEKGGKELGLI